LAGAVAFNEESADTESAGDFVTDDDASKGGRKDASDGMLTKDFSERFAKALSVLRELEHERALNIGAAVTSAGQFEMALADGADLLEKLQDIVAFHRLPNGTDRDSAGA